MRNFPINWVIDQDLPDFKKKKTYTGFSLNCPLCGKKGKFDINLIKNVARCNACGEGFNSLTLHAKLCKTSNKEAYADLWKRYKGLPSELKIQIDKPVEFEEENIAPLWVRSNIYKAFLEKLTLSDKHREMLRKRGLTDSQINSLGYKDVPEKEMNIFSILQNVCSNVPEVKEYFAVHRDVRIPGFYNLNTHSPKCVKRESGILIPVIVKGPHKPEDFLKRENLYRDENLISGFQIRFDEGDKRYSFYSSKEEETGCSFSGCETIHFRIPDSWFDEEALLFEQPKLERVVLTEGCLKADVASSLSENMPFIAILGVNNQKYLFKALKLLKQFYATKEIIICFDQDYVDNPNVAKALKQAKDKIKAAGLRWSECHWEKEYKNNGIKGIDDLLLYRKSRR